MKKLLLTIFLFVPIVVFSQQFMRERAFTDYKYYDKESKQYLSKKQFITKYGENGFNMTLIEAYRKGEVSIELTRWVLGVDKFNELTMLKSTTASNVNNESVVIQKQPAAPIKMRPVNLTIGCSVIGLSAAGYMIASSAINDKIKNNGKRGAELDAMIQKEQSQSKPNAGKLDGYTNELKELADKSTKLDKNRSTVGYICGATSIVGIVVIITGLHRDSKGVPVAHNTYINSNNNGLSASIMF